MSENGAPVKDPVTPEHKRFVLTQATVRLWVMAALVVALGAYLFIKL